jgi:transketolase N-terminal domain/subunit
MAPVETALPVATSVTPLSKEELRRINAYWRAANYLSVGQIYLYDNPLLRESLKIEHVKPRLLGHWGTTPGLNFIYVHCNRLIKKLDLNMIYITGPGHGGPGLVANTYLEGTYSEYYPNVPQNEAGMKRLFKQFSFPGGIPSHVAPETPGSIHEGGELGYSVAHAYGAALDNPDLLVCCVVGDGEAETGPLAASWHSNKFLNPARDGAVLAILHLNGYKIANPTILGRMTDEDLTGLFRGYGYEPVFVEGSEPEAMHQLMADKMEFAIHEIRAIQERARKQKNVSRPIWPMIILRSPKGWTGPKMVDGKPAENTWRSHQVPLSDTRDNADHRRQLEEWLRSYRPDELFDATVMMVDVARFDLAKLYLGRLMEETLDDDTLMALRDKYGAAAFVKLTNIPELSAPAIKLLDLSNAAAIKQANDPVRIARLIDQLEGDPEPRAEAEAELESLGTAVVPGLLAVLHNAEQLPRHESAMQAILRIGAPVVGSIICRERPSASRDCEKSPPRSSAVGMRAGCVTALWSEVR